MGSAAEGQGSFPRLEVGGRVQNRWGEGPMLLLPGVTKKGPCALLRQLKKSGTTISALKDRRAPCYYGQEVLQLLHLGL